MAEIVEYMGFVVMDYVAMVIYAGKACRYSESILENQKAGTRAYLPLAALILMWMVIFSDIPVMVVYLFLYSCLLLYFLLRYGNSLSVALFASGTFLFHIANLYMMLFGVFALICDIQSMDFFRGIYLYPVLVLLVILASMICLEIFSRMIDQAAVQVLLGNKRQLRFAATSLMFIDIYLLVLSIVFDSSRYTGLMLLFLVITSVLLFGAFYTAFIHAVRMSVLELYETRFKDLESQLEKSNRSIGRLQSEAYTDALTRVSSRRYGLLGLDKMMKDGRAVCVCLMDLDGLKAVNDTLGHKEGDRYLVGVAKVLSEVFGTRHVCRLGGDEFLVMIPDQSEQEALEQLETFCVKMKEEFGLRNSPVHPSVSYGVVEVGKVPFGSVSDILELADRKMYEMKETRHKNRP